MLRLASRLPLLLLLPALLPAAGCGGEPPPVAAVESGGAAIELPYGRFAALDLTWRLRQPLGRRNGPLFVFVHLLDEPGSVLRTFDTPWSGEWYPGERTEMRIFLHQSALAPPLEPGSYDLTLGLYDGAGRRWPLSVEGEMVDRYEYRVAEVRVPPAATGEPMFQFSPEWLDRESGSDDQVLARRWLTAPGRLRVSGVERPGELWLRLLLPGAGDRQQLVLSGEASQQSAVVGTDCGGVEVTLTGEGHHDVVLPLDPGDAATGAGDEGGSEDAGGTSCAVEVAPSFYLLQVDTGERRAVSLDGLAWSG